jgi:hypothetical protein
MIEPPTPGNGREEFSHKMEFAFGVVSRKTATMTTL